ncbi:MAG: putative heme d1 biosynthesis radical SAM protein NirJ2 [Desulfotomaculales bacterium]
MLVSWNTTNECNLRCRHCYRDAKDRVQGELTTEEGRALISEIARAGFKIMIFSGGEPLSRPDITELTAHAASLGLRPVFGTNGTLLTPDLARRLKGAGARVMGISLDSVDPAKHDEWRGTPGSWRAAVEGMRVCRETGLPFQINTTVVDWNYGEIDALTGFAVQMGAVAHHIFFLVPAGRAVDVEKESLRAAQYEELLRRILARQEQVGIELKPTCAPQFMRIAREMGIKTRFQRGCLAGIAYCVVDPRGNVLPCAYLQIPAGNVRKTPFSEIWAKSPLFGELRAQRYKGSCGACAYRKICGGCRARAYYYSGDYLGEEPWCARREPEGAAADA